MQYEWDEAKRLLNWVKHRVAFEAVSDFDWNRAIIVERTRHCDGEQRFAAIGLMHKKLHTIIFTWRSGKLRIISLRRANKSEEDCYDNKA